MKNYQRWCAMLSLVSLGLLLARAAAASSLPRKACELITVKDVESVLGAGYASQDLLNNQIMSTCGYTRNKGDAVAITLKREYLSAAELLQMEQQGIKQQGVQVTTVSGLGDSAYYFLAPKTNDFQLNLGKGNLRVILSVLTGGKPNVEAAMKLAKIAYSRLL